MKKIIASLISLIIVVGLVFVVIIPLWNSLELARRDLSQTKANLEQLEATAKKVDQLKEKYRELESEAERVFLALPKEEDIPELLVQFGALASEYGMIMESISFGRLSETGTTGPSGGRTMTEGGFEGETTPKITSALPSIKVDMNLSGNYINFKKYLSALSVNIRSMNVESLNLNVSQASEGGRYDYSFTLDVAVYYQ